MADNNNVNSVVDSLLKGLEGFATAKTVVGEAIHVNDTTVSYTHLDVYKRQSGFRKCG